MNLTLKHNFKRLKRLGLPIHSQEAMRELGSGKSSSSCYMDLHYDFYEVIDDISYTIYLAHTFIQNGDVMNDPLMKIRVWHQHEMCEAIFTQTDGSPDPFKTVVDSEGNYNKAQFLSQNRFLSMWLINLVRQGFEFATLSTNPLTPQSA